MDRNYHTHTIRCHHVRGTEREFIEKAIACGMRELGFSDHAPYAFPDGYVSGFRMGQDETAEYFSVLRTLKEEYAERITIHIGFEAEYYPAYFEDFLRHVRLYDCEYLILGQHFLENETSHLYSGAPTDDETYLAKYADQVIAGMQTGLFSYVAHPDLPNWQGKQDAYDRQMLRLCRAAAELDVPLEVNFLGLYERRPYPRERFWKLAAEAGCKAVFGSDAHEPEALDRPETEWEACEMLKKYGLTPLETMHLRQI